MFFILKTKYLFQIVNSCKARVRTKVYGKRLEIVQREHNHTILTERRKKGVLKAMMAEKKSKIAESDTSDSRINT